MKIETSWISKRSGKKVTGYYEESEDFSTLPQNKIKSVCAYCYFNGQIILVKNVGRWEPVAGHIEEGETPDQALVREIKEEANMKVLKYFPLGFQYTYEVDIYQTLYFCTVEPYGPFVSDPDGEVTEIKHVRPEDISENIEWKDIDELIVRKCKQIIIKLGLDKK